MNKEQTLIGAILGFETFEADAWHLNKQTYGFHVINRQRRASEVSVEGVVEMGYKSSTLISGGALIPNGNHLSLGLWVFLTSIVISIFLDVPWNQSTGISIGLLGFAILSLSYTIDGYYRRHSLITRLSSVIHQAEVHSGYQKSKHQ